MRIVLENLKAVMLSPDKPKFQSRREHSMREAAKFGIVPEWFKAIEHPNPRISASLSVIQIMEKSLKDDVPILLLEDDISSWNPTREFDVPSDVDVFRLGISECHATGQQHKIFQYVIRPIEIIDNNLMRVNGMYTTHAVVLFTARAKRALAESAWQTIEGTFEAYDVHFAARQCFDLVVYAPLWPTFYQDWMHSDQLDVYTKVSVRDKSIVWGQVPRGTTYNARVVHANGNNSDLVMDLSTWRTDESMSVGGVTNEYRNKCERIVEVDWVTFPKTITMVWAYLGDPDERVLKCVESWRACFPDYDVQLLTQQSMELPFTAESLTEDILWQHALKSRGGIVTDARIECLFGFDSVLDVAHIWHKRVVTFGADKMSGIRPKIVAVKQGMSCWDEWDHYTKRGTLSPLSREIDFELLVNYLETKEPSVQLPPNYQCSQIYTGDASQSSLIAVPNETR